MLEKIKAAGVRWVESEATVNLGDEQPRLQVSAQDDITSVLTQYLEHAGVPETKRGELMGFAERVLARVTT